MNLSQFIIIWDKDSRKEELFGDEPVIPSF